MKGKIIWWVAALLLASATPAAAGQGQVAGLLQAGGTARLTAERARVDWQSPAMFEPLQVEPAGRSVQAGDRIVTDSLGRARLSLAADATATIYPDSNVTILDVPSRYLQLDAGTVLAQVSQPGAPVVIETAEGRVEASGRVLVHRLVDHRRGRNSTWVVVQSGQARVEGGGSQVTLAANQQTWMENSGRPEPPLEARRDLAGSQFFLIDDLTNGAIMDEEFLASGPPAQTPPFPLGPVLALAAVVMVGGLIVAAMRSRPRKTAPEYPAQVDAQRGHPPASLLIAGGDGQPIAITGELSIGRAPDNRLPIADALVSSRHARIFAQGGEYVIEDLNSRNGTLVNGQRVASQRLREGDQIRIGQMTFIFQRAGRPAPAPGAFQPQPAPGAPPQPAVQAAAGLLLPQGEFVAMRSATLAIGRAPDSQVVLADPLASSRHARLVAEPGGVVVEDLDSTNGTFVNDQQVSRQLLAPGDRLRIGQTEMVFQMEPGQERAV